MEPGNGVVKGGIRHEADANGGLDTAIQRNFIYTRGADSSVMVSELTSTVGRMGQRYRVLTRYGGFGRLNSKREEVLRGLVWEWVGSVT